MTLAEILQLVTTLVAIATIVFAYKRANAAETSNQLTLEANQEALRKHTEQLQLNFFAEYTKRYQEITLQFPENINAPDFARSNLSTDKYDHTMRHMRAFFDLCSEEAFLNNAGYLQP